MNQTNYIKKRSLCYRNLALVVVIGLVPAGCLKWVDHEVLDLSQSMTGIEFGDSRQWDLYFDSEIALLYLLERPNYKLYAKLDTRRGYPAAYFYSVSRTGEHLSVKADPLQNCRAWIVTMDEYKYRELQLPEKTIEFLWPPPNPVCGLWTNPPQEFILDVEDHSGKHLGAELIKFDVLKNGRNLTDDFRDIKF